MPFVENLIIVDAEENINVFIKCNTFNGFQRVLLINRN